MIRRERDGKCLTAIIDRPEKAGSLTKSMLAELADIADDPGDAKVLILTGTGSVFSAGADLEAARAGLATDPVWERLSAALSDAPYLTIAALNGTVAGGAMGMVLACDLRIATPGAKFFYPVMKLGFLPQPSDPPRLRDLAGRGVARRILLAGDKLTATEAHASGLVDALSETPVALAHEWATDALGADPAHLKAIKGLIA